MMEMGVPRVTPSCRPERISAVSASLRGVTISDWPGRRRSSSCWMFSRETGMRGGQPSMTTPTPPPCDSPKVWMRKTWPKVDDMRGRLCGGSERASGKGDPARALPCWIYSPTSRPCCLSNSMAAVTPDSMVWCEVSRMAAPSATTRGAVVLRLSAASRLAMESTSPSIDRRLARTCFVGVDVDLVRGVGKHDRADVAAFHDDAEALQITALEIDEAVPDFGNGGNGGDVGVDGFRAQLVTGIDAVDGDGGGDAIVTAVDIDAVQAVRRPRQCPWDRCFL